MKLNMIYWRCTVCLVLEGRCKGLVEAKHPGPDRIMQAGIGALQDVE